MVRVRVGERYLKKRIGGVDDVHDADGDNILSWDQAVTAAIAWCDHQLGEGSEKSAPDVAIRAEDSAIGVPTVGEAVSSYVAMRDARQSARLGRLVKSDAHRLRKRIEGMLLADVGLADLSEPQLQAWRSNLEFDPAGRQRIANDFKAALNEAFRTYRKGLPPDFLNTVKFGLRSPGNEIDGETALGVRDNQILSDAEVRTIVKLAFDQDETGDLGRMVLLLASTGARFSQIARMRVGDVQATHGRVLVPSSRKGKKRQASYARVQVGKDVLDALQPAVAGRPQDALLLEHWRSIQIKATEWKRDHRGPWLTASEITRPWKKIMAATEISKAVVPYALRHSSIVRGIRAGLPIRLVAALHDTSVVMIERHYARWITEGLDEMVANAVVPFL